MVNTPCTDLHAKLLHVCEEFCDSGAIRCDVALDESHMRFDEEISEVVFRTIQELLTNVRQHAQARYVTVSSLKRRDGSIGISVCDDGIGLPPHRRRGSPFHETGGIGLWSIDHRLRELGAMLDIESVEGVGTRAMVILPAHLLVRITGQTPLYPAR
jgi:signal transduction histidine kinase